MGTPRQEVETARGGRPDIQIVDTYRKGFSEEALAAEAALVR